MGEVARQIKGYKRPQIPLLLNEWIKDLVAGNNAEKVVIKKLFRSEEDQVKRVLIKEAKILHGIKSEHLVKFKVLVICNNKHLMTGPSGNSEFCFPSSVNVPLGFASANIEVSGKQNSLFPLGPVIKCLMITMSSWLYSLVSAFHCKGFVHERNSTIEPYHS